MLYVSVFAATFVKREVLCVHISPPLFLAEMDSSSAPTAVTGKGDDGDNNPAATPTPAGTPSGATSTKEPVLSTHYHVRRIDGSWHVGEVIQKRNNLENGLTEYYVHYKDSE